jgi:hypothetical protein
MAVTAANVRALEGAIKRNKQAGGTANMGDAVYIDSNGKVQQARANAAATSDAVGILAAIAVPGATAAATDDGVTVVPFGPVGGYSGLTPGAIYYVSDTTAGDITATAPSGAGKWAKSIGYAESASVLFVDPGIAAARSSALA